MVTRPVQGPSLLFPGDELWIASGSSRETKVPGKFRWLLDTPGESSALRIGTCTTPSSLLKRGSSELPGAPQYMAKCDKWIHVYVYMYICIYVYMYMYIYIYDKGCLCAPPPWNPWNLMKYKEIHEINEICGKKKVLVGESEYGVARHRSKRMVAIAIPIKVVTHRAKEARRVEQRGGGTWVWRRCNLDEEKGRAEKTKQGPRTLFLSKAAKPTV